jgi:hypothetical protein
LYRIFITVQEAGDNPGGVDARGNCPQLDEIVAEGFELLGKALHRALIDVDLPPTIHLVLLEK